MKKIIHINRNVIQHNAKYGKTLPVCRVQTGNRVRYCMEVKIHGDSEMVYRPESPLKCGAKLWIETDAEITLVGEKPWDEIREMMK